MRLLRTVALAGVIVPLSLAPAPSARAADLGGGRGHIARTAPPDMADLAPFSWTGLYIGAHLGYGWSDVDGQAVGQDGDGWLAGGQVGYNLQLGRLVYGVEGDFSSSWVDGDSSCCGHSIDWLSTVRGRIGFTSSDNRWLFYGTGGAAWADIDYSRAGFRGHSDTQLGWVAGAGIERALTPNITTRVEYLYYSFDGESAPAGTLGGGATDVDTMLQTVRFGLNYKF